MFEANARMNSPIDQYSTKHCRLSFCVMQFYELSTNECGRHIRNPLVSNVPPVVLECYIYARTRLLVMNVQGKGEKTGAHEVQPKQMTMLQTS